jgi:hypothetical protein
LAIQFVPFGVAAYVVAIGAGAVLAKHIFESTDHNRNAFAFALNTNTS